MGATPKGPPLQDHACTGPPTPLAWTPQEAAKYDEVLGKLKALDSTSETETRGFLRDRDRMWLSQECILRYLRASRWDTTTAFNRLFSTLHYRRTNDLNELDNAKMGSVNAAGRNFLLGHDLSGCPCLYFDLSRRATRGSEVQLFSYVFEKGIDLMPSGIEQVTIIATFRGMRFADVPSLSQAREYITALQEHQPERLKTMVLMDMPWYIEKLVRLVMPLLDETTRRKLVLGGGNLGDWVSRDELWSLCGGKCEFEYDHKTYWSALVNESHNRRSSYQALWESRGRNIGDSEAYLRAVPTGSAG